MPQKKNNTTLVTEDVLVEAVVARVTDQFNQQLDARFARLELAFERGTAAPPTQEPNPSTRNEKRPADNQPESDVPPSKRPANNNVSDLHEPSQSSFVDFADNCPAGPARTLIPGAHSAPRSAMTSRDSASTSGVNNNNPTWKAWTLASERAHQQSGLAMASRPSRAQAYDMSAMYDHDMDAQVRHILEGTPHQLKGNVPVGIFPFKYVTRGPEKKKLSFNSLSLPEHILGMFRILDDDRVDPSVKPDILNHMREVAEDACEFDWSGHVRRWSEEVFDLVAEGRLVGGWSAHAKIQNLCTGMSRVDSARMSAPRDNTANTNRKPAAAASQHENFRSGHQSEVFKGGPPCPQFNSSQGCHLPSGHMANGKKQIHVCSYCLVNTAAAHPHSESHCRTKQRHTSSHF